MSMVSGGSCGSPQVTQPATPDCNSTSPSPSRPAQAVAPTSLPPTISGAWPRWRRSSASPTAGPRPGHRSAPAATRRAGLRDADRGDPDWPDRRRRALPDRRELRPPSRSRANPSILRPTQPTPARPRRRPPTQPSATHDRDHTRQPRPSDQDLPRAQTGRRENQKSRAALPQTPPRQTIPSPPLAPALPTEHQPTSFPTIHTVGETSTPRSPVPLQ
jgi:hypothetical protein